MSTAVLLSGESYVCTTLHHPLALIEATRIWGTRVVVLYFIFFLGGNKNPTMKVSLCFSTGALAAATLLQGSNAFQSSAISSSTTRPATMTPTTTELSMGLFDKWTAGGSGNSKAALDEQWEAQQEILRLRRGPKEARDKYFDEVEERRRAATEKQNSDWAWQTKKYEKGEDPIDEWKKRRADGRISNLDDQYGDEKNKGGIPLPMASFGVGGEFGVGGKYDNGGRFDLRLPYADQGYVDDEADIMAKIGNLFGGGKKKPEAKEPPAEEKGLPKKKMWPF